MNARMKALLGGGATVGVLAVVILGLWAFTSPKKPTVPTITLASPESRSLQAFKDGQAALSKEQTGTAAELFQSAVTIDPNNTAAKDALAALKNGSLTTGPGGSASTPAPKKTPPAVVPDSVWTQKLAIAKLLPTTYPEYTLSGVNRVGSDAVVTGSPSTEGATVTSVVWAVHDSGTAAGAAAFIKKVSKTLYTHNAKSITVNGVPAYFGTDARQFATVSYVRGRYVFEVVITTTASPSNEQAFAQLTAAAFATSP